MTVYTLRYWLTDKSFGYETSQVFRQNVLNDLGIANKLLVPNPYSAPYWREQMRHIGFNPDQVVILPHLYSDIDVEIFNYSLQDFEEDLQAKGISWESKKEIGSNEIIYTTDTGYFNVSLTSSRFVSIIIERSLSLVHIATTTVHERPFYISYADGRFEYLNRSGETTLRGLIGKDICNYYWKDCLITPDDLFLHYLIKNLNPVEDIVLNDQLQAASQKIKDYCKSVGARYRDVLHYNHVEAVNSRETYTTVLDREIYVASPYIIPNLAEEGVTATFLPPTAVNITPILPIGLSTNKLLLVGNFSKGKRIAMAVEAMRFLPELELHIYGGLFEEIQAFKEENVIPENVIFKGFVPSVTIQRNQYVGYLSCSKTEMFANAMVECLGQGLIPILSRVDYGHNQVLEELGIYQQCGFDSVEDLVKVLKNLANLPLEDRQELSKTILDYANKFSYSEARKQYKLALGYN